MIDQIQETGKGRLFKTMSLGRSLPVCADRTDVDRLVAAAIVEVSVESQTGNPCVAKLAVLQPGMLDDRNKTRPQESKARPRTAPALRARWCRPRTRACDIEPLPADRADVRITSEDDRAVLATQSAEERPRTAMLVDDESADDDVGARCHVAFEASRRYACPGRYRPSRRWPRSFEPVLGHHLEERLASSSRCSGRENSRTESGTEETSPAFATAAR